METEKPDREFLDYYYREMNYLKQAGAIFSKEFPKIAGRLNMDSLDSPDPHVGRLIESFAFLSANLQKKIDNISQDFSEALLEVVYPHLKKTIPAMSIAKFKIDTAGNKPSPEGYRLPRGTEIFSYSSNDAMCKFRTVFPLTLLPIVIKDAKIIPSNEYNFVRVPNTVEFEYKKFQEVTTYVLEITLESIGGNFSNLKLDEFLCYLNIEDKQLKQQIYQAIFSANSVAYCARADEKTAIPLLPNSIFQAGFLREETAIPPKPHESHSQLLLQEYFHFPEKFMFFKVRQLAFLKYLKKGQFLNSSKIKILVPLNGALSEWSKKIKKNNIMLDCTPIVNLYKLTTDPINFDHKQTFYQLAPHKRKEKTTEIYQIEDVFLIEVDSGEQQKLSPYFSFNSLDYSEESKKDKIFWWSKTETIHYKDTEGINTLLSMVDVRFKHITSSRHVVYAKTLCTNCFLSNDIPKNAKFEIEEAAPISEIICLQKPVAQQYSSRESNNLQLIAQLSLNYLGFPYWNESKVIENLKCILMTYMTKESRKHGESLLSEIQNIEVTNITKRIRNEAWKGMLEGVHICIYLKKSQYLSEWFLLSKILFIYFSMNCQVNVFIDLSLKNEGVEVIKFESRFGERQFL